jgi:RNA polymerase sigma-70 factor (ECF subfamily)
VTKSPSSPQYAGVKEPDRPSPKADEAPFDAIYEREFDYVWRSLGRLGVPESELADAVHEVFLVLHRRWADVDKTRPIRPWLFGVARRVAAAVRVKRRELPAELDPAEAVDPIVAQRRLLWRALALLDDDRRDVVILHDLEGYSGAEIAEQLDVPVNTVHSRLRLARADLLAAVHRVRRTP